MLINQKTSVVIKKVSRKILGDVDYPCYQLVAMNESGDYRLIFCCTAESYILLNARVKRYQAINALRRHLETSPYPIFETGG